MWLEWKQDNTTFKYLGEWTNTEESDKKNEYVPEGRGFLLTTAAKPDLYFGNFK
jgi:hypothetical protein